MELLFIDRFLDPTVQETLGNITFIGFILSLFAVTIVALVKKWIVIGWTYKEKEKENEKLEERLRMMEALAWRGTNMAKHGTNTAEYYAYRESNRDEPHE